MRARILSIATKTNPSDLEQNIRVLGVSEEDVLNEAEEILAEELEEMNRPSRFCYTPTEIAKAYGMKGNDLNSFLKDKEIIHKEHGCYNISKAYKKKGYTAYRYTLHYNSKGQRKVKATLVWTDAGREFINSVINNKRN